MDPHLDAGSEDQKEPAPVGDEAMRLFVEQLRSAPAEQVIAEVFSTLLTAAEVKLGRRDARVFIDLCSTVLEHGRAHVSEELAATVERSLGQLRLGQVSAENQPVKPNGDGAEASDGDPSDAEGSDGG